jgi:hypothetical protein
MSESCQRPIVDNRTRPVILGAYWNVTGRCLHRVRSFDHRVRSSREKWISPFLTIRLDLTLSISSAVAVLAVSRARLPRRAAAPPPPCAPARSHSCARAMPQHHRARARAVQPSLRSASTVATVTSPELRRRSRAAGVPRAARALAPPRALSLPRARLAPLSLLSAAKTLTLATRFVSPRLCVSFHLRDRLRLRNVTSSPWIRVYRRFSGELLIQSSISRYSRVSIAVSG